MEHEMEHHHEPNHENHAGGTPSLVREGHQDESHQGHGTDHSGHEEMFRSRFWISLALGLPVILFSTTVQQWLGFSTPVFPGSNWIVPVLSIIIFWYGGIPFIEMAIPEIKQRAPGMMSLITLAIVVAFLYSIATTFLKFGDSFYWELVTLIDVMLLGHWIEMRSVRQASGSLGELAKLLPDTAEFIYSDGSIETVPIHQLGPGNLILIRPGESVPVDGKVVEGQSHINESMITGESNLVSKSIDDQVIAGTSRYCR